LEGLLRGAAVGPYDATWRTPDWLLPHQIEAARRVFGSIRTFGGAILADAVGLGKTYVALAVAERYQNTVVAVPAALLTQWQGVSSRVGVPISVITHESLSRGAPISPADLIVVDEAHRFRNPNTRRYEVLAAGVGSSHLLLLTATPIVNRPSDLSRLLRLFAADSSFVLLGMPSIAEAMSNRDSALLTRAASAAIVARSAESVGHLTDMIPRVSDRTLSRACPISRRVLMSLLRIIDSLAFPSAFSQQDCALLRLHLLHRLASSSAAFGDTVRRHLAYVERALDATRRGEILSRSAAREVFKDDEELQLALGDLVPSTGGAKISPEALRSDQRRLAATLELLSTTNGSSPKSDALFRILGRRAGRKTIVFTTAVATAHYLARGLGWKEVAVVGSGKSWIASGRIDLNEVLTLFAPFARGRSEPHRSMRVSTLITTDLASEGLDLQDADAVVHYDLPWTPLRLDQRIGRIARLGSTHRNANVYWFAPPDELERRLRLEERISRKVGDQIGSHVPATSSVGRARIVNRSLETRERLARFPSTLEHSGPSYAVVRGPLAAVVAVVWRQGSSRLPEFIALNGDPPRQVSDFRIAESTLSHLLNADASRSGPPNILVDSLIGILRDRLASADRGVVSQPSRLLARRIMKRAYEAGQRRERRLLATLDEVLDRLREGLNVGGERTLADIMNGEPSRMQLAAWLADRPLDGGGYPTFEIVTALFGDGSEACPTP
jgi:superfamily II DNA or RNA helicase